jgi:hypothetical protein
MLLADNSLLLHRKTFNKLALHKKMQDPIFRAKGGQRWTQAIVDDILHIIKKDSNQCQVHIIALGDNNLRRPARKDNTSNWVLIFLLLQ